MSNIYAYIRVSTKDQNEERQLLAMEELEIPRKILNISYSTFYRRCMEGIS